MKTVLDLKNDGRFYIDDFNTERLFGHNGLDIISYSFVEFPLGSIYMEMEERILRLNETVVYKYLDKNNDSESQYMDYCDKYGKKNPHRNRDAFDSLINDFSVDNNDYDPLKGVIIVNQYGFLLDGQHRACLLLKKYGPKKKIPVLKIKARMSVRRKLGLLFKYAKMIFGKKSPIIQ